MYDSSITITNYYRQNYWIHEFCSHDNPKHNKNVYLHTNSATWLYKNACIPIVARPSADHWSVRAVYRKYCNNKVCTQRWNRSKQIHKNKSLIDEYVFLINFIHTMYNYNSITKNKKTINFTIANQISCTQLRGNPLIGVSDSLSNALYSVKFLHFVIACAWSLISWRIHFTTDSTSMYSPSYLFQIIHRLKLSIILPHVIFHPSRNRLSC